MRVFTHLPMHDWNATSTAARQAEAAGFDAVMTVELGLIQAFRRQLGDIWGQILLDVH